MDRGLSDIRIRGAAGICAGELRFSLRHASREHEETETAVRVGACGFDGCHVGPHGDRQQCDVRDGKEEGTVFAFGLVKCVFLFCLETVGAAPGRSDEPGESPTVRDPHAASAAELLQVVVVQVSYKI